MLKYDWLQASQEVHVYDMPQWGAVHEPDALPAVARDEWRIPEGGNLLALFALRGPDGGRLGVVRSTALGTLQLELASPPRRGDMTPEDAARGESVAVLLPPVHCGKVTAAALLTLLPDTVKPAPERATATRA